MRILYIVKLFEESPWCLHIFEPFFSVRDEGKGVGMGLSVAPGVLKSHGGYMAVVRLALGA
jgi:C4-dicarboxylate-specific signal transduction histidine kinase